MGGHDTRTPGAQVQPQSDSLQESHERVCRAKTLYFMYFRKRHVTSHAVLMDLVVFTIEKKEVLLLVFYFKSV